MPSSVKRASGLIVTPWAALCIPTTTNAVDRTPRYVPIPGYVCTAGRAYEDEAWITRRLDATGKQHDVNMEWRGFRTMQLVKPEPRVSVLWTIKGERPLDIDDGSVFIEFAPPYVPKTKSPRNLSIELSTKARAWPYPIPIFSSAGRPSTTLNAAWGDVRAFARGTDQLFVILRDRKGKIFQQAPLPPSLFANGETAIRAAMAKMDEMSADYRTKCSRVDNIDDGDIVLT